MKETPYFETSMVLLTIPQIRGLLNSLFDEKITFMLDAFGKEHKSGEAEYMTTRETLDFVHLSKPTLNKLRREGHITAVNASDKRVLYKRSELVAYLESAKQQKGRVSPC